MKIGIIGSGNIGGTLGKHWAEAGHEVFFSSRHPEELKGLANQADSKSGTVEEALDFGEIILLAVPFNQIENVAKKNRLEGKILIDATNPYPQRDGEVAQKVIDNELQTATGYVNGLFPKAKVVKAFNSVFYRTFQDKAFRKGDDRIAVHICSDDKEAKQQVIQLIEDIGLAPMDLGDLSQGKYFEPNQMLYNTNLNIKDARELWNLLGNQGDDKEGKKAA